MRGRLSCSLLLSSCVGHSSPITKILLVFGAFQQLKAGGTVQCSSMLYSELYFRKATRFVCLGLCHTSHTENMDSSILSWLPDIWVASPASPSRHFPRLSILCRSVATRLSASLVRNYFYPVFGLSILSSG